TNTHTMSVDCLFLTMQRPPSSTLFPYTTLFRSLWPHARFDGFHPRLFHFQRGLWSFPFHTSTRGLSLSARFGHGGRMEQRRRAHRRDVARRTSRKSPGPHAVFLRHWGSCGGNYRSDRLSAFRLARRVLCRRSTRVSRLLD